MIITHTSSYGEHVLAAGAAAGQPVSGLSVRLSRGADVQQSVGGDVDVFPAGEQVLEVSFTVPRTDAIDGAPPRGRGVLRLDAPDGAFSELTGALISSRRAVTLAGNVRAWTYTIVATAADLGLDLDGSVLTDAEGNWLTDSFGRFLILPD